MSKEFYISANRRVVVKNQEDDYIIFIEEIGSELKTIKFPAKRRSGGFSKSMSSTASACTDH